MNVIQRRLTQILGIELSEPVSALATGVLSGRPSLLVVLPKKQLIYDLSDTPTLRLDRIEHEQGVLGVARISEGWLVWGDCGLRVLTADARCVPSAGFLDVREGPVHDIGLLSDGKFVLRGPAGLEIRSLRNAGGSTSKPYHMGRLESIRLLPHWPGTFGNAKGWLAGASRIGRTIAHADGPLVTLWTVSSVFVNGFRASSVRLPSTRSLL